MGVRGRPSSVALSTIGPLGIEIVRRPEPPPDLTDEQAIEWRAVVNRLPADWFPRETHGMLAAYCRHVVTARRVSDLVTTIEAEADFVIAEYDLALRMQEREGRAISSLATRMRMSQHSSYDKKTKKPAAGKRPWDVSAD